MLVGEGPFSRIDGDDLWLDDSACPCLVAEFLVRLEDEVLVEHGGRQELGAAKIGVEHLLGVEAGRLAVVNHFPFDLAHVVAQFVRLDLGQLDFLRIELVEPGVDLGDQRE